MCNPMLVEKPNIHEPVAVHIGENLIHPVAGGRFRTHKVVDGFSHLEEYESDSLGDPFAWKS